MVILLSEGLVPTRLILLEREESSLLGMQIDIASGRGVCGTNASAISLANGYGTRNNTQ